MEHVLREAIARYEGDLVAFTKALVAIPTENPPGVAYRACADLIAQKLAEKGMALTQGHLRSNIFLRRCVILCICQSP